MRGIPAVNRTLSAACACAVLAVVGLVSGCGSSKSAAAPSTSTPAPSSSSVPAPAPAPKVATAAQLAAIVLQPGDLPAGWTAAAHQADSSEAANAAALAHCYGVQNTEPDRNAVADSQDFSQGNASIVSNAASYKTASDVQVDVGTLSNPKFVACNKQQVAAALPAGSTLDNFDMKVTAGAAGGPSNVAGTATGSVTFTSDGQQQTLYLTSVFFTGPSIEGEIDFESGDGPIPVSLQAPLIAKMSARIAGQAAST
jgi:hypothetical protein